MISVHLSAAFFSLLFPLYLVRLLHWAQIFQQKEYRFDRLRAFCRTEAGQKELSSLIHLPLSLEQLKRPALTPKIILILTTTILLNYWLLDSTTPSPFELIIFSILSYLCLPLLLAIVTLPFNLITLIVTRYYQNRALALLKVHQPTIIGITGSYGKTTTKILLHKILSSQHQVWASPKSYNTPLSLPRSFVTTYQGQPYIIVEYAAYKPGEIRDLTYIFAPDIAILTGITHQHFATFKTFKSLFSAKGELPAALKPGSPFILNDSDKNAVKISRLLPHLQTYPASQVQIAHSTTTSDGHLNFTLLPKKLRLRTNLLGKHYLPNLQLAIQTARLLKIKDTNTKFALENFRPTPEFVQLKQTSHHDYLLLDAKTSNPKGFEAIINLAASIKADYKVIFSSGIIDLASQSGPIHTKIGQQAYCTLDLFIHTSLTGQHSLHTALKHKYINTTNTSLINTLVTHQPGKKKLIVIEGKIPSHIQDLLLSL